MPGDHALLSPSGASRWLACTPSARLEQTFPDRSGDAAREGTLAHTLGELLIKHHLKLVSNSEFETLLEGIKENSFYTPVMQEHCEDYAAFIMERYNAARVHTPDALIFLEERIDLRAYVPEGFGTGDNFIIANTVLDFTDFKYGKGVAVSAVENAQMKLYALGALERFDFMFDIQTVRMTIFQPRLDIISEYEISVEDLRKWGEEVLKPKAALAFKGAGEYQAGAHCQFCKAKAICKANADFNLELAKHDFKCEGLLSSEEVADVLTRADLFKSWIKSVEDFALEQAVNYGAKWPGYKLVEGRSNRAYKDADKVAEVLKEQGFSEEKIYEPRSILGITAMEKAIGKKVFTATLNDYIIKPPGKPTLVPLSDKREELNSIARAQADFAEDLDI